MESLHQDLIFQILSWASPEALPTCRQVSQEWRSIVDDPRFQPLYNGRGRARYTISGYFINSDERVRYNHHVFYFRNTTFVSYRPLPPSIPPPSLGFLPNKDIRIWCCSRLGLLCCESVPTELEPIPRYYICRPTTRQWRAIPNPKTRYFAIQVSMVVRSTIKNKLYFKIVRFSVPRAGNNIREDGTCMQCEIFESATWTWKRLKDLSGLPFSRLCCDPSMEIDGILYYLTSDSSYIFAFDVEREDWRMIQMPQLVQRKGWSLPKLVACDGELCCVRFKRRRRDKDATIKVMEIWAMKKYSKEIFPWERKDVTSLESEDTLRDLYTPNVAFLMSTWEATWFDLSKSKKVNEVELHQHTADHPDIFKFESDLAPICLDSRIS